MKYNINKCGLCNDIWNRDNLCKIDIEDMSLYLCEDCMRKLKNTFIPIRKVEDVIAEIDKGIDAYQDGGSGNELVIFGLIQAKAIIEEHTGIGEEYK